jgi:hypothetical protein
LYIVWHVWASGHTAAHFADSLFFCPSAASPLVCPQ